MKTIKQLEKEEQKIRTQIDDIEEVEVRKIQIPRLKKMVGGCFVYRNNNYGASGDGDWNVFKQIIDWFETDDKTFYFIVEQFSIDCYGKIVWEVDNNMPYLNKEWWDKNPFSGYDSISKKEYEDEKIKMIGEMTSQKKLRKSLNSNN